MVSAIVAPTVDLVFFAFAFLFHTLAIDLNQTLRAETTRPTFLAANDTIIRTGLAAQISTFVPLFSSWTLFYRALFIAHTFALESDKAFVAETTVVVIELRAAAAQLPGRIRRTLLRAGPKCDTFSVDSDIAWNAEAARLWTNPHPKAQLSIAVLLTPVFRVMPFFVQGTIMKDRPINWDKLNLLRK